MYFTRYFYNILESREILTDLTNMLWHWQPMMIHVYVVFMRKVIFNCSGFSVIDIGGDAPRLFQTSAEISSIRNDSICTSSYKLHLY